MKIPLNWKREFSIAVVAVILATAGIKASDRIFDSRGRVLGIKEGCAEGMVFVPDADGGFCIDNYEVSAGTDCPHGNPASQAETRDNLDYRECRPVSLPGAAPWRFVSQDQAVAACAKAGKRLPTAGEWLAAALGTPDPAAGWGGNDCQVARNWPDQPGRTGSGADCVSAAGAYDMIGNVWEWVEGTVQNGMMGDRTLPPKGYVDSTDGAGMPGLTNPEFPNPNYNEDYAWIKDKGVRGIARGGYWDNGSEAGQYSVYIETPPSFAGAGVGFRCAK